MSAGTLSDLVFKYEWEDPDGVTTPELAATWVRLEIWAGKECVTQVEDQASESARRGIYCSLHPLAEWAAYNWWLLNVHYRLAGYVTRPSQLLRLNDESLRRHVMRSAGDGFRW